MSPNTRQPCRRAQQTRLPSYGALCLEGHDFVEVVQDELLRSCTDDACGGGDYETFYDQWQWPIYYAWLAGNDEGHAANWIERLRYWQEDSSYMHMVAPNFGLRRDYDWFLCCGSPAFWATCAALIGHNESATAKILGWMRCVLDQTSNTVFAPFHAAWMAIVAARSSAADEHLDTALRIWSARSAGAKLDLLCPPHWLPLEDGSDFPAPPDWPVGSPDGPLSVHEFREAARLIRRGEDPRLLALELLLADEIPTTLGERLAASLLSRGPP